MAFAGFPREGLLFLGELGRHNERAWFQEHRNEYDDFLLEPARDFVEAIGAEFDRAGIDVHAEPKVGGSIMRIARDTRFSKDKRPYKTHVDLWFWQGSGPSRSCPGYWFRLTPDALLLGAGMHSFEPPLLERYREAVADPVRGEALGRAVTKVSGTGADVWGKTYKRIPRGYEAQGARAELLLHGGLYAGIELTTPPELHTARFPAFCVERYTGLAPLQEWLVELVGGA